MVEFSHVAPFLGSSVVAGIAGTAMMTLTLKAVTALTHINARMVEAIGSVFTKSMHNAAKVGMLFHAINGIIFGVLYTLVIIAAAPLTHGQTVGAGVLFGFLHGLVVCFGLVWTVADHHPVEEFRSASIPVGLAHLLAHVVFGLSVGITIAACGIAAAA